ncbi:hypothetical protein JVT61DRAFT_9236 [Boletus reticuloceps]|uniref:Uncharacterized protein n=1 Tax=Boletus reticuloceps TaxID=495285 RepID=A0A8I2YGH7_9AGAM|nr:hypothetical protein JVT61DRAFT_9236 [Boletus reticuloceps]
MRLNGAVIWTACSEETFETVAGTFIVPVVLAWISLSWWVSAPPCVMALPLVVSYHIDSRLFPDNQQRQDN